ncbi:MAG TPA: HAD-IC family P-type ATPase, partial [Gemmatales bacterium]|nr:HAD-IC family P-type ATPase [Gemmatales bacterium]
MAATASASEASESPIAWHALPPVEVAARLGVSLEGLTAEQAADRLERFGPNVVHRAQTESPFRILWRQINNPLILVLIGSAVLALAMGKPTDGAVVFGVVVINALIGFIQEFRAGKAVASLSAMVPEHCMVERQGQVVELLVEQLVPGDLVLLAAGDKVPADLRLLESRNLHANESSLTGESVPVAKRVDPVATDTDLGDRTCLAFGGTLITAGTGRGLVVATGAATELGRISALLHETPTLETPLTKSMETFGRIVALVILIVAAAILVVGLARGFSWIDALLAAITLAVPAIPEGLPAIITIALAIGVRRMAARRAIIRLLPAVETLGSTTVICSDKTGTLTKNEMTVVRLWTKGKVYRLTGVGYIPEGRLEREAGEPIEAEGLDQVRPLLWAGLLCNDASIQQSPSGDW